MSVADSGEYVCRANNNIDAREASIMVSVSPNAGNPSGESDEDPGRDQEAQVTGPWGGRALQKDAWV